VYTCGDGGRCPAGPDEPGRPHPAARRLRQPC
jgi:hypothetical protein